MQIIKFIIIGLLVNVLCFIAVHSVLWVVQIKFYPNSFNYVRALVGFPFYLWYCYQIGKITSARGKEGK